MAAPSKSGSEYVHTDQQRDNRSHDDKYGVNVVEIVGENAAGTALIRIKANSDGSLGNTYGIQAISDDGTYKYFFFEDNDTNYYILRKHKTNKVFTYTAGTGGYSAVYVDKDNGPSGSPTWGTKGSTF